ncbi:MAG TPA: hypothetical protein VKM55_24200 [Candidatus Lokiarchaeia archaeon]|nr:hypothetical protein [Candidatus Lokiarchaeia archaeon]
MAAYRYENRVKTPERDWASIRLAHPEDAAIIQNIYNEVYKGTYSYLEYLDTEFLRKDMTNGHSSWYLVVDNTFGTKCGCVSFTVDETHLRAYTRGMMMRPAWQGRRGNTMVLGQAYQHFLQSYQNRLRVMWGEARSTSVKPQLVAESVGMIPVGILPSKDVFFGARETAIIMAAYSSAAWRTRDTTINLELSLMHLYEYARANFKQLKNDTVRQWEGLTGTIKPRKVKIAITPIKKEHGYTTYVFACETTNDSLTINVNRQCMNAEHMEIQCSNPDSLFALLDCMLSHLIGEGIHYVEGYCPANEPEMQGAFLSSGMRPLGYLPAWNLCPETGLFIDQVVFAWIDGATNMENVALSDKAKNMVQAMMEI